MGTITIGSPVYNQGYWGDTGQYVYGNPASGTPTCRMDYRGNRPAWITGLRAYAAGDGNGVTAQLQALGAARDVSLANVGASGSAYDLGFGINSYVAHNNMPGSVTPIIVKTGGPWVYFGRGGSGCTGLSNGSSCQWGEMLFMQISYCEVPSAPGLTSVTPQNGTEAVVAFTASGDNGGTAITGYTIQYATNSAFTTGVGQVAVAAAGTHLVTGLTAGVTYYWRVLGKNGLTNALSTLGGAASGTLSALQGQEPQDAPGLSVTSSLSGSSANFSLTPPSNTGGAPITGYDLEYRLIGGSATQFFSASQTGNRAGLAQGQVYEWRARARNAVGAGPWSNWITVTQNQTSLDVGGYFDGSSEDVSDTSFSWDGTTNNSMSSATGLGVLGWRAFTDGNAVSGGTGVVAQVNNGIVGPRAARVIFKSDATAPGFIAGPKCNATDGAAVEPGTTYFGSIMVRPSRVARLAAAIVWTDAAGTEVGRSIGAYVVVGQGQEQRLFVAAAAPAGAGYGAPVVIDQSVPIAENSYPYPSFELPSGTVAIRTNYVLTPVISALFATWVANGSWSHAPVTGGREFTATVTVGTDAAIMGRASAVTTGAQVATAFDVENTGAVAVTLRPVLAFYENGSYGGANTIDRGASVVIAPGQTIRLTHTASTPASRTTVMAGIVSPGGSGVPSGSKFVIKDGVSREAGSSAVPFSGSTPAAGDFEFAFTGTENNSTSIMRAKALPGVMSGAGSGRVTFQSSEWAAEGTHSMRTLALAAPDGTYGTRWDMATFGFGDGDTVTVVIKAWLPAPLSAFQAQAIVLEGVNSGGAATGIIAKGVNQAGEQELRLTWTIEAGVSDWLCVRSGGAAGESVWWDLLTIVPGVYDGPPFTGSTPNADGTYCNWLGVPNMSPSEASNGNGNWRGGDFMEVDGAMMSLANYPYIDGSLPPTTRYEYFWQGTPHSSVSWREDLGEVSRVIVDPDCPPVPAPPRPPIIENSCIEEIEDWRRYWMQISAIEVPAWRTTLPTLELRPVFEDIRQLRVRYYPDPDGLGWDQMDPNDFCAEGIISYIPLGSTMIVDGITGRIWIEQDGELLPADHLVYGSDGGPHILPYLDGGIAYLVSVDTPQDSPIGNLEFDVSLTWRM